MFELYIISTIIIVDYAINLVALFKPIMYDIHTIIGLLMKFRVES